MLVIVLILLRLIIIITFPLFLNKELPVHDLECLPQFLPILYSRLQQLALLASRRIDFSRIVLSFYMRHIDRDDDVGILLFQSDHRKKYADEVWLIRSASLLFARWRCGEEGVGWCALAV